MQLIVPSCEKIVQAIKRENKTDEKNCFEANISLNTLKKFYNNDCYNITFGELMSFVKYLNVNILDFLYPDLVFSDNTFDNCLNLWFAIQNRKI